MVLADVSQPTIEPLHKEGAAINKARVNLYELSASGEFGEYVFERHDATDANQDFFISNNFMDCF